MTSESRTKFDRKNGEIIFFFWTKESLANYDKQMRLGNAAVDDCNSQGLPDFYFSRSLSLFFLSLARPFYFTPCVPFAPSCSLPLSSLLCRREREDEGRYGVHGGGGGGGGGAGGGRRGSHRDFLFASFVIPLISLPDRRKRPSLPSFCSFLFLLLLLSSASPRPTATPAVFQPLEQRFIFIAMFYPLSPLLSITPVIPISRLSPQPQQPPLLELSGFFLSVLLPRSFLFFSLLLSFRAPLFALPVVSNFAKGWRRECAPRPSHGGVFFLHHLASPRPVPPLLSAFFLASFASCARARRSYFSRTRAAVSR